MTHPKGPDDNAPGDPVRIHDDTVLVENDNARPKGIVVDTIIIHADAGTRSADSTAWIEDDGSKVSYHTLIERDGDVQRYVEPERRAWHAGVSEFMGRKNVNDFSLGLSFGNRNDGVEDYTELQYQIGAAEAAGWMRLKEKGGVKFAITLDKITTHAAVARPVGRKTDPGPKFDMDKFKRYVQLTLDGVHQG